MTGLTLEATALSWRSADGTRRRPLSVPARVHELLARPCDPWKANPPAGELAPLLGSALPPDFPELLEQAQFRLWLMAYAHRAGVVHRDLKPENLFCTPQGLKVVDFGVARGDDYTVATATGVVMGTPCYMAPEQLDAQIDPATDQYALGIILYELVTGAPPFDDPDPMAVVEMQMGRAPKPLRQVDPALPAALEAVVGRMLEKNAKRRYADLGEAHGALLACLDA